MLRCHVYQNDICSGHAECPDQDDAKKCDQANCHKQCDCFYDAMFCQNGELLNTLLSYTESYPAATIHVMKQSTLNVQVFIVSHGDMCVIKDGNVQGAKMRSIVHGHLVQDSSNVKIVQFVFLLILFVMDLMIVQKKMMKIFVYRKLLCVLTNVAVLFML